MDKLEHFSPRVLVLVFNPVVDADQGTTLIQSRNWNRVDELLKGYIADVEECSGGLVRYQVVERRDVDAFPVKADGFQYTAHSFMEVMNHQVRGHDPDTVDYHRIVQDFNLIERVTHNEIDEVWMFGFPFAGFYESRMVGRKAFWCNAPALENTEHCPRRFVMMGFSYERGVGEMLEDLGHRAESIMDRVYAGFSEKNNLWKRFSRYDKVARGLSEVGMMHFAPNSTRDYEWGSWRLVLASCDDWLNFPNLTGRRRWVNCAEWGRGDIRAHHKWWFKRLPKVTGETNGIDNNWWRYIIQVDDPFFG